MEAAQASETMKEVFVFGEEAPAEQEGDCSVHNASVLLEADPAKYLTERPLIQAKIDVKTQPIVYPYSRSVSDLRADTVAAGPLVCPRHASSQLTTLCPTSVSSPV